MFHSTVDFRSLKSKLEDFYFEYCNEITKIEIEMVILNHFPNKNVQFDVNLSHGDITINPKNKETLLIFQDEFDRGRHR
ncbi:MAG: hypothetical protein WC755_08940 [Candidatus Woesearchaeota archaeon]|jgi:hypothetical protein